MKRSEINKLISETIEYIRQMNFHLPGFAYWTPEDWEKAGPEYDEIRDNMLGWDITDYGSGDFKKIGLLLFTIRNGNLKLKKYTKPYAEKMLIIEEEQITPFHFHWNKTEDIINRGGGNLMMQLYNSTEDEKFSDKPIIVSKDGCELTLDAGSIIKLKPGESITIPPMLYHKFWGEKGSGKVLSGEVSAVNDDKTDNRFYNNEGRFSEIEEDQEPLYLLCNEY